MTCCQQVLAAGGTGFTKPAVVLSQVSAGAAASPNIIFTSDGTFTVAGNGSSANPSNWWLPTTTGVGAPYWIQLKVNSGTAPDGVGGVTTPATLNGSVPYQWTQSVVGTKSCNATVSFYTDSAGTQLVNSWSFNVTAQRTS